MPTLEEPPPIALRCDFLQDDCHFTWPTYIWQPKIQPWCISPAIFRLLSALISFSGALLIVRCGASCPPTSSGHTVSTGGIGYCPATASFHAIPTGRGFCPPISSDHAVSANGCSVSTFTSNMREVIIVSCQLRPAFVLFWQTASCEPQCFYKNDWKGPKALIPFLITS
jgi:hypothetical protein